MLTKQQMLTALDDLVREGQQIREQFLRDLQPWSALFATWLKACESTLEAIYGSGSDALRSFRAIYFYPPPDIQSPSEEEKKKAMLTWFDSGLRYAMSTLIGYRYSLERILPDEVPRQIPNIFISHGGPTRAHVDGVRDLLDAVGLYPVIVQDLPNLNLSINEKVRFYVALSVAAVVLATVEDETVSRESRARPNVENEVGMLQAASNIGNRIVYLKEDGVKFASNYQEKVWIRFDKDRIQDAFIPILKELRAFALLG